jgi:hypothetical protein
MPIGVKDIIETADMPTEQGSPLFKGWQSWRDSACVVALREAGAVIVGKTVITEFAAVTPGPTRNLGTRRGTQVDRAAAPPLLWPPGSYQQRLAAIADASATSRVSVR